MKPRILALRAIGSTFALGIIRTGAIWGGVIVAVLIAIIAILAYYFSSWWWLVAIPVGLITLIGFIVWLIFRFILKSLQPQLTSSQLLAINEFTDKAQRLFENATTPYPLLAGRIVIETVLKRKDGLITEVIGDSRGLKEEFDKVVSEFDR